MVSELTTWIHSNKMISANGSMSTTQLYSSAQLWMITNLCVMYKRNAQLNVWGRIYIYTLVQWSIENPERLGPNILILFPNYFNLRYWISLLDQFYWYWSNIIKHVEPVIDLILDQHLIMTMSYQHEWFWFIVNSMMYLNKFSKLL